MESGLSYALLVIPLAQIHLHYKANEYQINAGNLGNFNFQKASVSKTDISRNIFKIISLTAKHRQPV